MFLQEGQRSEVPADPHFDKQALAKELVSRIV